MKRKIYPGFATTAVVLLLLVACPAVTSAQEPVPGTGSSTSQPAVTDLDDQFFAATGRLFRSVDGGGSTGLSYTVDVEKPNLSATVQAAFLLAASTGFSGFVIPDGDITLEGVPVNWDAVVPSAISSSNHRADVTSVVKPIVDAASAGLVSFTVGEPVSSPLVDGVVLAVVFDDPTQAGDSTIVLLFGAQDPAGDTFSITLAEPIDPSNPEALADMCLGISFGFQGPPPTGQDSLIDVNGVRITSSAGGQDDGEPADGALITVGGLGDTNANPADPNAPSTEPRSDDELYSLLPVITATTTSIVVDTNNPSIDDNIFFACFEVSGAAVVGAGIVLSPLSAINPVGTDHTVTATVVDGTGAPSPGVLVMLSVLSGPNTGVNGMATTDANGEAQFTYAGTGGAGVDQIQASFDDGMGNIIMSNIVSKEWQGAVPDVLEIPTMSPLGLGLLALLLAVGSVVALRRWWTR